MEMAPPLFRAKSRADAYARRHGQDAATALDEVLADALERDRHEFEKSLNAIRQGTADVKSGRARPVSEFFEEVRAKDGFPR